MLCNANSIIQMSTCKYIQPLPPSAVKLSHILFKIIPQDSLIRQSLECMLIQFLLGLLKSRANLSSNPATVIAQIVSALKTMAQNLNYSDQVLHILNSDPIWAEFRDQNHDLFIEDSHKRGMITGKSQFSIFYRHEQNVKNNKWKKNPEMEKIKISRY